MIKSAKLLHELDAGRLTQWESTTRRPSGRALSEKIVCLTTLPSGQAAVSHGEVTALFGYNQLVGD